MANTQNLDLVKPLGTDHALVSVLNSNSDKIDAYAGAVNAGLDGLRDGLGILADGNTHAAITSGQFVYVKNHQTLPQGLYQATTNIAANGTLSTSNLTADPKGGLNTLSEHIATKYQSLTDSSFTGTIYLRYASGVVVLNFYDFKISSASATLSSIIPSSYRPSSGQTRGILQTADSSKFEFLQVGTNGDITVNNSDASKYYYGSITYII